MQVSHGNIDSYFDKFNELKTGLDSLKTGVLSASKCSNIQTQANAIDIASWSDIISSKVGGKVTNLKDKVIPTISSSISNEFANMCSLASELVNAANTYKSDRSIYNNISNDEENKIKKQSAWNKVDNDLTTINSILAKLANIDLVIEGESKAPQQEAPKTPTMGETVVEAGKDRSKWERQTVWTVQGDKTQVYQTEVNGQEVSVTTTKEGEILFYSTVVDGEVHWYDPSGKEISFDTRQQIFNEYNGF